ncbi:MAG: hypothetical protein IKP30_03270 [Bacteroidaceae bacterium]|nr:hypothetical protein [Bacteroidaceae bacterium]
METIIKNTIVCGQNDLKNMSVTQNGTVTVHTTEGVELPHAMMDNVNLKMGGGEIVVSKEIKKNFYCGPRSKSLHKSDITDGKVSVVLDKGRICAVHIHAECGDVTELLAAINEARTKIGADKSLMLRDFRREANDLARSYNRDKKAYDRREAKRVAELMECESANRAAIRAELKIKNEE